MARFQIGNLVGDPFALATVSMSSLAWVIALVASIVSDIQSDFPNYFWWAVAYELCCIVGVTAVLGSDTTHVYGIAVVGYSAVGLVVSSFAVDGLVNDDLASKQASSAGLILLCMVNIIWIFYFGSTPQSRSRSYIDSFAPHKEPPSYRGGGKPMSNHFGGRPETTISGNAPPQMYTSAQLNGFERSSPMPSNYGAGAPVSTSAMNSQQNISGNSVVATGSDPASTGDVVPPTEYPYRAKAIYSYEANPDDANEISFTKHEVLEVSDVSGRWWQAKKATGETGIAPSNYLILL